MLKIGAWIIFTLLCLPLQAQDTGVLPNLAAPPPVDMISPVPAPDMPLGTLSPLTQEMPKELKINNQGGAISGDMESGTLRLGGPVKVEGDNGMEMFGDTALLDTKEKKVTLEGNVTVYQGNMLQRGERAVYFYERKFLDAKQLRASMDPILLESGKFTVEERDGKQVFIGENAAITTHDVENPNFWIRSKKTTIYPDEKIVFNNLRVYAGDIPVFWLPYLSQPLDADLGYHFTPGTRSNWGPFLLNRYGIMLGGKTNPKTGENEDAWLLSRWNLDLLTKRGVGTGVDLIDKRLEIGGFSAYHINDLAPDTKQSGLPRGMVNENRYQFELKHRLEMEFPDDADWRLDTNLTLLSDQHYLEDFKPSVYQSNPVPDNTIGVYRKDDQSLLSLHTRMRINDFYRADTRLPEIAFDQARSPLLSSPVLHEGSTSFGIIGEQAADLTRNAIFNPLLNLTASDPEAQRLLNQLNGYERQLAQRMLALPLDDPQREAIRTQLLDSNYSRFNTYQELSMPFTLGGALSITPQAGLGHTHYGAVDGPVDNFDRTYLHMGAEASLKFTKDLGDHQNSDWGLDGLMHVIQPYSAWSLISTDDFNPAGPLVDRITPTTRPRPLDPTRYTAIDEIQDWNVLRLGTRNRLLSKRDNQSMEWLYLDTYIDAFFDDPLGDRTISNLYNDFRWQPVPWLGLDLETQFPIASSGSGFSEFNSRLRFLPTENVELSLGYRLLNGHPVLIDSNRVELQAYTRLNESWGVGSKHTFEIADNTLEYEQYTLHRDLGNWVAGLGFTHRDNRFEEEYAVVFSLTLKDFPSGSLPFQLDAE